MTKEVVTVRLAEIMPDPDQPRTEFNEAELIELGESIKKEGQLQPVKLVKIPDGHEARAKGILYKIVFGERRYRGSKKVGLETIQAIIEEELDTKETYRQQLLENAVRQDLSPMNFAKACKRGVEEKGMTLEEIAGAMGRSPVTIQNDIALCRLTKDIGNALDRGEIPKRVAYVLAECSSEAQMLSAFRVALRKPKNATTMLAAIDAFLKKGSQTTFAAKTPEDKQKELESANRFNNWAFKASKWPIENFTLNPKRLVDGRGKKNRPGDKVFWEQLKKCCDLVLKEILAAEALDEHTKATKDEPSQENSVAVAVNS